MVDGYCWYPPATCPVQETANLCTQPPPASDSMSVRLCACNGARRALSNTDTPIATATTTANGVAAAAANTVATSETFASSNGSKTEQLSNDEGASTARRLAVSHGCPNARRHARAGPEDRRR